MYVYVCAYICIYIHTYMVASCRSQSQCERGFIPAISSSNVCNATCCQGAGAVRTIPFFCTQRGVSMNLGVAYWSPSVRDASIWVHRKGLLVFGNSQRVQEPPQQGPGPPRGPSSSQLLLLPTVASIMV